MQTKRSSLRNRFKGTCHLNSVTRCRFEIKSSPIFLKSCPKELPQQFLLTKWRALKLIKYYGFFCMTNFHPKTSKHRQSGHTPVDHIFHGFEAHVATTKRFFRPNRKKRGGKDWINYDVILCVVFVIDDYLVTLNSQQSPIIILINPLAFPKHFDILGNFELRNNVYVFCFEDSR